MFNQSTIYIREDLLNKLMETSVHLNMKRSRLIEALLIKCMNKYKDVNMKWDKLKYQEINEEIACKRICVFWRQDIYVRRFDAMKVLRMSVSHIIAQAIENYLDELINEIQEAGTTYNYSFLYSIHTRYYSKFDINISIWGVPDMKILKKTEEFLSKSVN